MIRFASVTISPGSSNLFPVLPRIIFFNNTTPVKLLQKPQLRPGMMRLEEIKLSGYDKKE